MENLEPINLSLSTDLPMNQSDKDEDLLKDDDKRLTILPIKNKEVWDLYKKHESTIWHEPEVKLERDLDHWHALTDDERFFLKHILAFFASSDIIVGENLSSRFLREVKMLEAKVFYTFQMMMENIHCVSYDTLILTDKGYYQISHLEKQFVKVWNGYEFSNVYVQKTSSDPQPLLKVTLSNGSCVETTFDHRWVIQGSEDRKLTKELSIGDKIITHSFPIIHNGMELPKAYEEGGMFAANKISKSKSYYKKIPLRYTLKSRLDWLAGYLDINLLGNFQNQSTTAYTWKIYDDISVLRRLQLLFNTLGMKVNISGMHIKQLTSNIDNSGLDHTLGNTYYLYITFHHMVELKKLGFNSIIFNTDISKVADSNEVEDELSIISVENNNKKALTYCFNENLNHTGIFNGILTGQSEVYSKMIDVYVKEEEEKTKLLNAVKTMPAVGKMAKWAMNWIESSSRFAERLVAFAIYEGVFFSGPFCSIFWLTERGRMPGLAKGNEFIARDEGIHTDFAILLYTKYIKNKLPHEVFTKIMSDAVNIVTEFITVSLPCKLIGMNSKSMIDYIKFIANRLTSQLGHEKIYPSIVQPFAFMDRISLNTKSSFFEDDSASYRKEVQSKKDNTDPYADI
jgi:ribonucleotide reductase beta subunit family protein with ferritin-like domain